MNRGHDETAYRENENESVEQPTWYPPTDIYETKDEFVFKLEVPGLAKDDVKIELNSSTLSITGERKGNEEVNKEDFHRLESYSGKFCRSFSLPKNIDSKKVSARIKDGILELRVPKAEEAKPKSIPIDFN
jgi:HSP20 family protein